MRRLNVPSLLLWLVALTGFVGGQIIPLHLHTEVGFAGSTASGPAPVAHSIYQDHPSHAVAAPADNRNQPAAKIDLQLLALAHQLASAIVTLAAIALTLLFTLLRRPQRTRWGFADHLFFRHWDGSHSPPLRAPPV